MSVGRAARVVPVLALLHIHLHHFTGPPVDYLGLALAAGASWAGLPGPGEPVLIAAGVFAAQHKLDIGSVILIAWVGATAGGIIGWAIGRVAGRAIITAPGPLRRARLRAAERGEEVFGRYPVIAIVLTPSWVAGINRVRPVIYHPTNAISALAWAAGIGLGAYWVGPTVVDTVGDLGAVLGGLLVIAVLALVGAEVARRRRRLRKRDELVALAQAEERRRSESRPA